MKITLEIDAQLLEKAKKLTSIKDDTLLIKTAIEDLVERKSRQELQKFMGTEPDLKDTPRR